MSTMVSSVEHKKMSAILMSKHEAIADLIGNSPFQYLDIPMHGNIGDMLIMHGTLAFFRKKNLVPKLMAPIEAYHSRWIDSGDVIVFHGGGNFGDLYPVLHGFRENIVKSHKANRIILCPQTIHFASMEKRAASAEIYRAHPDVHFFVRDVASLTIAKEFSDKVYLVPDMAHHLYPIQPREQVEASGNLRISRSDEEGAALPVALDVDIAEVTDWPELVGEREKHIDLFRRASQFFFRRGVSKWTNKIIGPLWVAYTRWIVRDAVRLYARYELIITDRLHGHILACLMDKKNIVIDNNYGKNSTYVEAWTICSELVTLKKMQVDQPVGHSPTMASAGWGK